MGAHAWVEKQIAIIDADHAARNTVIWKWGQHFPDVHTPPSDFYERLAARLEERGLAELDMKPVFLQQGGLFTARRMYLRMQRERIVFDICGLPIADGTYFSGRGFDRRRPAGILDFLIAVSLFAFLWMFVTLIAGSLESFIVTSGIVALLWSLMRMGVVNAVGSVDRVLSNMPVIGPIYEFLFHPDTFYRQDTIDAYCTVVDDSLKEVINGIAQQHGLRPMTDEERKSFVRDPFTQRRW